MDLKIPYSDMKEVNNMVAPIFSVVIPTYNSGEYIEKAIVSVLQQDIELELIIIDDCSTDQTAQIVDKYMELGNVLYVRNTSNLGVAQSRNKGVELAKGEYIAFLDADDWWSTGKLQRQYAILQNETCSICCTARELMDDNGNTLNKVISVAERIDYQQLLHHNSIACSSVVLRRDIALEFPMVRDDLHEDYINWLQIVNKYGSVYGINEPFLKYRISVTGKSRDKWKSLKMTYGVYRYLGLGILYSTRCLISHLWSGIKKYK